MPTIWDTLIPDALQPPAQDFFLLIDDTFELLIDDTHELIIQEGSQTGYTVVWTLQNLGQ